MENPLRGRSFFRAKVKLNLEHPPRIRDIKYHEMKRFLANMSLSTWHPPVGRGHRECIFMKALAVFKGVVGRFETSDAKETAEQRASKTNPDRWKDRGRKKMGTRERERERDLETNGKRWS